MVYTPRRMYKRKKMIFVLREISWSSTKDRLGNGWPRSSGILSLHRATNTTVNKAS